MSSLSGVGPAFIATLIGIILGLWIGFLARKIGSKRAGKKADKYFKTKEIKEAYNKPTKPKEELLENHTLKSEETDHSKSKEVKSNEAPTSFPSLPTFLK